MAGSRGISANVRPFPNPGNLKTVGEVSSYLNTLGNWVRDAVDQINKRAIQQYPHDALPPLDGLVRIIGVPDDPIYGQCLAYNGTGTSTEAGWNRIPVVGTIGGAGQSIPSGGTTSQVLGKHSTSDFDMQWQTPHYVPAGGGSRAFLGKNSTADYDTSWLGIHEVPAGGTGNQVLTKNSTSDYDASWATPHYLTTGGTGGQVLVKNSTADYDASWTNSAGTFTSSELISSGKLTAGGTSSWAVFSSTAAYLGQPLQVANQTTTATVGTAGTASAMPATPAGYLQVKINGGTFSLPYFNP